MKFVYSSRAPLEHMSWLHR